MNHLSDHHELERDWFNCEEGFRALKKVQQAPWPSPKGDSAAVTSSAELVQEWQQADASSRDWIADDCGKGDEAPFRLGHVEKWLSGESEHYHQCCVTSVKHPEIFHVWGCFSSKEVHSQVGLRAQSWLKNDTKTSSERAIRKKWELWEQP